MTAYVTVRVDPGHEAAVNRLIPQAVEEANRKVRASCVNNGEGTLGQREYSARLGGAQWGVEFLRAMDKLAIATGLRVQWPREGDKPRD